MNRVLVAVANAQETLQHAEQAYVAAVKAANDVVRCPAELEKYARQVYPEEWKMIDAEDSNAVYTQLNKHIPVFEKTSTDETARYIIRNGVRVNAPYYAKIKTEDMLRAKRNRIRKTRKLSKK